MTCVYEWETGICIGNISVTQTFDSCEILASDMLQTGLFIYTLISISYDSNLCDIGGEGVRLYGFV